MTIFSSGFLHQNFWRRDFLIIFCLGFSCGLPLAFLLSTLKVVLVDLDVDIKTIGFFALVSLPYSLKFIWAPLVDSVPIYILSKKIGQRASWIIINQLAIILSLSFLAILPQTLPLIIIFALLIAIFSATADMAVDAFRIESFAKEDQGFAASFYVYGYRIGMLVSGAFALFLSEIIPWSMVYLILAGFMLVGIFSALFAKKPTGENNKKLHNFLDWLRNSVIAPFKDFAQKKYWLAILLFIILFKLCDAFAGNITMPFLLEIGFSKAEIATIVKTFGLFATLVGALMGGFLVKKSSMVKALWLALILQAISNLAFCFQAALGHDSQILFAVIFVENFSGGIGDAVFVAYLSLLCNVKFSATQYALLISLASSARAFLAAPAGFVAASYGWFWFFVISAALAIPAILFLIFLSWRQKVG